MLPIVCAVGTNRAFTAFATFAAQAVYDDVKRSDKSMFACFDATQTTWKSFLLDFFFFFVLFRFRIQSRGSSARTESATPRDLALIWNISRSLLLLVVDKTHETKRTFTEVKPMGSVWHICHLRPKGVDGGQSLDGSTINLTCDILNVMSWNIIAGKRNYTSKPFTSSVARRYIPYFGSRWLSLSPPRTRFAFVSARSASE